MPLQLLSHDAVLSEAVALYREAQAMDPQANQPFADLDSLSTAAGAKPGSLVGVQVFGSSSVMDDMALAATWLAVATGGLRSMPGLVCLQQMHMVCTCTGTAACSLQPGCQAADSGYLKFLCATS
jgi:hypothetical protein